jgi:hypothetical protein
MSTLIAKKSEKINKVECPLFRHHGLLDLAMTKKSKNQYGIGDFYRAKHEKK